MRYVTKEWAKDEYTPPKWEIGERINGKKRVLYRVEDFMISQLDESYLSDKLFDAVAKLWKSGAPEKEVKEFYESQSYKENKDLYDYEFHALTEMRKKKTTKPRSKRATNTALKVFLPTEGKIKSMTTKAEDKIKSVYSPVKLNLRKKKTTTKPKRKIVKK